MCKTKGFEVTSWEKELTPLVVRCPQLHNKSGGISRLNINQEEKSCQACPLLVPCRACQSVTFPAFPPLLSVPIGALAGSPPSSLFHLRLSLHTQRCLLLLLLSISHSLVLPLSPSHIRTSPERSLLLPGFSLSSPLPISSTDRTGACCAANKSTTSFVFTLLTLAQRLSASAARFLS